MIIWLNMIVAICIWRIFSKDWENPKVRDRFLWFSALLLIFVMGSRNAEMVYGSDINNYYRLYAGMSEIPFRDIWETSQMEKGYLIFNYCLSRIVPWPQFILYVEAACTVGIMLWFIRRNTSNVFWAVLFFITLGTMQFFLTGFRQSFAICFGLMAFELMKNRRFVAWLLIPLAISFHRTAIVWIPVFFLIQRKITFVNIAFLGVATLIIWGCSDIFMKFGNDLFEREYTGTFISSSPINGVVPLCIYSMTMCLIYWKLSGQNDESHELLQRYSPMVLTGLLGMFVYAMRYNGLVIERISFYFTPVFVVLLVLGLQWLPSWKDKLICYYVALICCIGLFVWRLYSNIGSDYVFFWETI